MRFIICDGNSVIDIKEHIPELQPISEHEASLRYQSGDWPLSVYYVTEKTAGKIEELDPEDNLIFEILDLEALWQTPHVEY